MEVLDYIIAHWWSKLIILAGIIATAERLWKPIRWTAKGVKRVAGTVRLIENLAPVVDEIKDTVLVIDERSKQNAFSIEKLSADIHPNGGGSGRDVLNRIELQLKYLAKKNKVDMEMSHHGIFQCDMDGRITYVNKTYANAIGVTKEELFGISGYQYIEKGDFQDVWRAAREGGMDINNVPAKIIDIDGNRLPCKISATRFDDGYAGYIDFQKQTA